ncbi:MAG: hypothetical protein KDB26_08550 [Microthrixaceae bacterium]|nr:hypothetical protein [Microthrixaceae bacterium]
MPTNSTVVIGGIGKTHHAKALANIHTADERGRVIVLTTPRSTDEWTPTERVTVTGDIELVQETVRALIEYRIGLQEKGLATGAEFDPVLLVVDAADKLAWGSWTDALTAPLWGTVDSIIKRGKDTAVSVVLTTQHLAEAVPNTVLDDSDVLVTAYRSGLTRTLLYPLGYKRGLVLDMLEAGADAVYIDRGSEHVAVLGTATAA